MLDLDDVRWSELRTAYGPATEVPLWIRELGEDLTLTGDQEPWFGLWSALAHQGDVYSGTFAAVPHIVALLARSPTTASSDFFQFPAWVEICRARRNGQIPAFLVGAYRDALAKLPTLAGVAASAPCSEDRLLCILSAIAGAKGFPVLAETILELGSDEASEVLQWLQRR